MTEAQATQFLTDMTDALQYMDNYNEMFESLTYFLFIFLGIYLFIKIIFLFLRK